jgi:hypothetical protein
MSAISQDPSTFVWGLSKFSMAVGTVMTSPFKDVVDYIFPKLRCYLNSQYPINDPNYPVGQYTPPEVIVSIQEETRKLLESAGITEPVAVFAGLNAKYEGFGSHFGSALVVPWEQVQTRNFSDTPEPEKLLSADDIAAQKNRFTDNEVRFQMARGISRLRAHSWLLIAARVAIAVFAIYLTFTPAGWLSGLILFVCAGLLYISVNRLYENGADIRAVEILANRLPGEDGHEQAAIAAINALRKMQAKNIDLRNGSTPARLMITPEGDVRWMFDPHSPPLTSRIELLETYLAIIRSEKEQLPTQPAEARPLVSLSVNASPPPAPSQPEPLPQEAAPATTPPSDTNVSRQSENPKSHRIRRRRHHHAQMHHRRMTDRHQAQRAWKEYNQQLIDYYATQFMLYCFSSLMDNGSRFRAQNTKV